MTIELTNDLINKYINKERYRFGSSDSIDYDIVIFLDELPSIEECKEICYYFKNKLDFNLNLCVLKNGIISQSFKGSCDEMTNSLYYTFHYHVMNLGLVNPIIKPVKRNLAIKTCRCIRIILSLLSKSQYRPEIKEALKSYDFKKRVEVLANINFNNIPEDILTKDNLKSIAFQIGQTIALIDGKEYYTKSDVSKYLPALAPFLNRWSLDDRRYYLQGLNEARNELIHYLDFIDSKKINTKQTICEFYSRIHKIPSWKDNVNEDTNNNIDRLVSSFTSQKIDLKYEKVIGD